ncbi:MAG: 23S rRNA (guanosine(2251)-2'-O)-methyltransferase RlmB [Chloroflexi bacterium]|nr:23S rRNA (guanosine(2251)-2'-O)-methyltransferase RlmB [Chloroflexota bacterium]
MREILYGRHAVLEALRAERRQAFRLVLVDTIRETGPIEAIRDLAAGRGVPIQRVPRRELDALGDVNHQGVALEASEYPYGTVDQMLAEARQQGAPPFLLLLDLIQDPQNLGSLLRTADAVGVHGVVVQRRRAVGVTPAVSHASAGAVEHLAVAQVTNLVDAMESLKERDVWVVGLEAASGAQWYNQADLTGGLALVVGSEGEGLRRLVLERCDFVVQLPMLGQVSSLNAAVAGSIVLYEALRQRRLAARAA